MVILPKLDRKVVNLDKNLAVLGYYSGKNIQSFIKFVNNSMYVLTISKGKRAVKEGGNDDKNREDTEIVEQVQSKTAEGIPLCAGENCQGQEVTEDEKEQEKQEDNIKKVSDNSNEEWMCGICLILWLPPKVIERKMF